MVAYPLLDTQGRGYTLGNPDLWEFWLMADIEEGSHHIEFAVLHEYRHLWQRTKLPTVFLNWRQAECDAYPYAFNSLRKLLSERNELGDYAKREIDANEDRWRKKLDCQDVPFREIESGT